MDAQATKWSMPSDGIHTPLSPDLESGCMDAVVDACQRLVDETRAVLFDVCALGYGDDEWEEERVVARARVAIAHMEAIIDRCKRDARGEFADRDGKEDDLWIA